MQFHDFYEKAEPAISFEVFPPKTEEGAAQLKGRLAKLRALRPSFITVTYGALGSSRERTLDIASTIKNTLEMETAHHLTCVGSTRADIDEVLRQVAGESIENIVALRGDPPQGESRFKPVPGGYRYAVDLVKHIRSFKRRFGVAVAGYPEKHLEAPDFETDLRHLKEKVDAGADVILTQLFYDNRHYFRFVERCREVGIEKPIVPGLLPILGLSQIQRITGLCGSSLPLDLVRRLEEARGQEQRIHEIGISHTAQQAVELLESRVPGIHFYVLNRYFHIAEIMKRIRPALDSRRPIDFSGPANCRVAGERG